MVISVLIENILGTVLKTFYILLLVGNLALFYCPTTVYSSGTTTNINQAEHNRPIFGVRPSQSPSVVSPVQKIHSNTHRPKIVSLDDMKEFVRQTYQDILFREPREDEINDSFGGLQHKKTCKPELVMFLLKSAEFVEKITPAVRLYQAYFTSIKQPNDLLYWLDLHSLGLTLADISNLLVETELFTGKYGKSGNGDFVISAYQTIFGRRPDPAGLEFWQDLLDSDKLTRGQLMVNLSGSAEYQQKSSHRIQLTMLTIGLLKRVPDQKELEFWLNNVDSNAELGFVNNLLVSDEYKSRFR